MTFDILIPTVWSRTGKFVRLLRSLVGQLTDGVGIIACRDNMEMEIGPKRQHLVESSDADYVAFVDDDDEVSPHYVKRILEALESKPDLVGIMEQYVFDGVRTDPPAMHALASFSHLNPIRRELMAPFHGGIGEDGRWREAMRRKDLQTVECVPDEVMYVYHCSRADRFDTLRPMDTEPVLPAFPFVRYV